MPENDKDFICKNFLSAESEGVQLLFKAVLSRNYVLEKPKCC